MNERGEIHNESGEGKKGRGGGAHKKAKSVLILIVNMTMSDSFLLYWLIYLLP